MISRRFPPPWTVEEMDACFIVKDHAVCPGLCLFRGRHDCTVEELMRKALLFVIVVAMVATGLWLFVAGLFFESETNIWYVVSGGWLIGLGGDQLWRTSLRPSWASKKFDCHPRDEAQRIAVKHRRLPRLVSGPGRPYCLIGRSVLAFLSHDDCSNSEPSV